MDARQKKLSIERRKERDHTFRRSKGSGSSLSPGRNTLMRHLSKPSCTEDTTYADPTDIIKFAPEPAEILRSPSASPPPLPSSELNWNPSEDLYDSVKPVSSNVAPDTLPSPRSSMGRGYDHLTKVMMSRQTSEKYDHLTQNEGSIDARGQEFGERPPAPLPEKPQSISLPEPLGNSTPLPDNMYATINEIKKKKKKKVPTPGQIPEPPPPVPTEATYAVVDPSRKKNKSLTTLPVVTSGNGHMGPEIGRKPPVPSPPSLARTSGHDTADGAQMPLYTTVDTSKRRTSPPVRPRSPRSPMVPSPNGGSPELLRGSLEQRKKTAPLVKPGGHFRRKSNETLLVPVGGKVPVGVTRPAPPTAPKPSFLSRRSPSPAMGMVHFVTC